MRIRHSSDIGIADFPLSDVHGSDYPLFETVAGTVTTVRLPTQEAGKPPGATRSLFFFFASFRERSFQLQNLPAFSLP
jgi:hypothetical protein